jgi:hypothetical protein
MPRRASSAAKSGGVDPKTIRLHPRDLPADLRSLPQLQLFGSYMDLCRRAPQLGRHSAYGFFYGLGPATWVQGVGIVTGSATAAGSAFRRLDRLLVLPDNYLSQATILSSRQLSAPARIGQGTAMFALKLQSICGTCENNAVKNVTAYAVAWRQGSVIGAIVTTGGEKQAIALAQKQWAHAKT